MVYVKKVEEENIEIERSIGTRKIRLETNLVNTRVVQVDHNFRNRIGMHHHLLMHMRPKIELSIMDKIH